MTDVKRAFLLELRNGVCAESELDFALFHRIGLRTDIKLINNIQIV